MPSRRRPSTATPAVLEVRPPGLGVQLALPDVPISRAAGARLAELVAEHLVVGIRDVPADPAHQLAVTRALGTLVGRHRSGPGRRVAPELRFESDVAPNPYNRRWHSDTSWAAVPARYTVLQALDVEEASAPTDLLDTSIGLAALPVERQDELAGWTGWHHVGLARGDRSPAPERRPLRAELRDRRRTRAAERSLGRRVRTTSLPVTPPPGVAHPVVRDDAVTGRRHLRVGEHVWRLDERGPAETRAALDALEDELAPVAVAHRWRTGDLLIFDNVVLLHRRGDPGDGGTAVRELRRTMAWCRRDARAGS